MRFMQLEPKGRLSLSHLEGFFEELRKSRSRTLSLGLLRASSNLSPSQAAMFDQVLHSHILHFAYLAVSRLACGL